MKRLTLLHAFLQAAGIFSYVALVSWLLKNGEYLFGADEGIRVPIIMLLLLVLSAAITGLLFFGRSIHLYLSGEKSSAIRLILWTLFFLAAIFLAFLITSII